MLRRILTFLDASQFYIMGGLLLGILITSMGWYATSIRVDEVRAGYEKTIQEIKTAQKDAEAKAYKLKAEQEKKDYERQKEADATAESLRGKYDSILREYAAAQRKASGSGLSSSSAASTSSNRSGEDSKLSEISEALVIPYGDAQICAENTARLEAVHDWAVNK